MFLSDTLSDALQNNTREIQIVHICSSLVQNPPKYLQLRESLGPSLWTGVYYPSIWFSCLSQSLSPFTHRGTGEASSITADPGILV